MTKLSERKTQLNQITNGTARYRGHERPIVIEVTPEILKLRLLGTRTRFELSWRGVYDYAAQVAANRERERRKAERSAKRVGGVRVHP